MKFNVSILIVVIALSFSIAFAQDESQYASVPDAGAKPGFRPRHSLGSSVFLMGNFAPGDSPYFFQLNYGYQFSEKDALVVEAVTWTYYEPLGTYGASDKSYPGKIRSYGIGLGYQRFHWKKLYSTVQATPFLQQFYDSKGEKIQKGFQLYLQLRLGYRYEFAGKGWFIEPSVAFNYWPVNSNTPESFEKVDRDSPNYFLFEPGLHFGFKF